MIKFIQSVEGRWFPVDKITEAHRVHDGSYRVEAGEYVFHVTAGEWESLVYGNGTITPAAPGWTVHDLRDDLPTIGHVIGWYIDDDVSVPVTDCDGILNYAGFVVRRPDGSWFTPEREREFADRDAVLRCVAERCRRDRKSTRLNSSH